MIFRRITPHFLSALTPLTAADFPLVPRSDRVLTVNEVKRFWIDRLGTRSSEAPQRRMESADKSRETEVADEIRSGHHDVAARLVCLSHNIEAWTRLGNMEKAQESRRKLLRLRQCLAKSSRKVEGAL